jgi:hypothetical protein
MRLFLEAKSVAETHLLAAGKMGTEPMARRGRACSRPCAQSDYSARHLCASDRRRFDGYRARSLFGAYHARRAGDRSMGRDFSDKLPASRCWLVWDKENTGTFADAELAWTNQDKITKLFRHQWSGLMKASERGERRVHPTQKPVALAEWVIETLGAKAKAVIDLFLGSGSTLIACERLKKQCLGMELSPAYVDVAVMRWQNFTGQKARLESTGETFRETLEDRRDTRLRNSALRRSKHHLVPLRPPRRPCALRG